MSGSEAMVPAVPSALPPAPPPALSLAEVRDWLGLAGAGPEEDAGLAGLIRAAEGLAEAHTGCALVAARRAVAAWAAGDGRWAVLAMRPVRAILGVAAADGGAPIQPADHAVNIAPDGTGRVRLVPGACPPGVAGRRVMVELVAGLAGDAGQLPAPLRQGLLLAVAQLRRGEGAALSPAIAELWAPWRRRRLL